MKFIIEHLEKKLYQWCLIEYKEISKIAGKNNLIFTNIKNNREYKILRNLGETKKESVKKLKLKNACLLDPKAGKTLAPEEAAKFDYFIFGGILGDFPERSRTQKYLAKKLKNVKVRNLTEKQMPTDTAVLVTKLIINRTPVESINFIDSPAVKIKNGKFQEEIILPYRYVSKNNRPLMPKAIIKYLKSKKEI